MDADSLKPRPLQVSPERRFLRAGGIFVGNQICAQAKNLEPTTETKTVVGVTPQDNKGKIVEFAWWMKKQGYKEGTILSRSKLLEVMVKRGANLYDPETVKEVIAKQVWSEGRKENAVNAYSTFLKMTGGTWNPSIYGRIQKLPFIPKEEEIDSLIASCAPKAATLLQTLKETAARVGEAWALQWIDLDVENRTLRITPEKGSTPRIFKISPKLMSMLLAMPHNGNCIFGSYLFVATELALRGNAKKLLGSWGIHVCYR